MLSRRGIRRQSEQSERVGVEEVEVGVALGVDHVVAETVNSILLIKGGSPGLVVMGRDSQSEGRGFEYQRHVL